MGILEFLLTRLLRNRCHSCLEFGALAVEAYDHEIEHVLFLRQLMFSHILYGGSDSLSGGFFSQVLSFFSSLLSRE
jgi:hypothetical protein